MPFRDLLKKKEKIENDGSAGDAQQQAFEPPQFKIMRSDTHTEEILSPPGPSPITELPPTSPQKSPGRFRGSSNVGEEGNVSPKIHRSLSDRLHLHKDRSRTSTVGSANLPSNLPDLSGTYRDQGNQEDKEAQWEERATILANTSKSPVSGPRPGMPTKNISQLSIDNSTGRPRSISDAQSDVSIQEAIRLHEEGRLTEATRAFKQLADSGNVLSEVLYGLSLRHGWGCEKDEAGAFTYLSSAASDSAALEAEALKAGLKKGGAAKGELVLAIFELGNCYRYGWGTPIDKVAARQYYETAANLGDTDAMNEAAWCYLEGFGGKKDKIRVPKHDQTEK
ncbi:hypothetical protein LTR64_006965 [Lithohypha guttulata]|uniref:uncharacterized protein n=1 Tax=Lithohypha guttulata TaxID=1690604 RepID=UPI002DDF11DD|nr:hypothetical protein LTR51_004477 [Lithohypha guttulata]